MKKSYYNKDGWYIDVTTGRKYAPKQYCEICGRKGILTVHHKLAQHKCLKDLATKKTITPKTWTKDFIEENQELFTLCIQCHSDVHNCNDTVLKDKYGIEKSRFIFK